MFSFQSLWPPIVRILYLSVCEEKHPKDLKMGISERGDSNLHFGFLLICRRRCLSHGMAMWCGYGSYDAFFGAPLVISMLLNSTNWYCKSCINLSLHFLGHPFCIFVHAWGPPTDMFNMLCQFLPSGLGVSTILNNSMRKRVKIPQWCHVMSISCRLWWWMKLLWHVSAVHILRCLAAMSVCFCCHISLDFAGGKQPKTFQLISVLTKR